MLKSHYSAYELHDLITEYSLLKEVDHPNVIKLLGACTDKSGEQMVVCCEGERGQLRVVLTPFLFTSIALLHSTLKVQQQQQQQALLCQCATVQCTVYSDLTPPVSVSAPGLTTQ